MHKRSGEVAATIITEEEWITGIKLFAGNTMERDISNYELQKSGILEWERGCHDNREMV